MAKDARALREEAAEATASGKHKRALAAYLELERLEPRDAQWAKRAGETYRKLGNNKHAVEAFARSAERYAQNGFLVQAIAVCKLILQIEPQHADTLRRLASINDLRGTAPTRTATMAENNPALHENPNVQVIRRQNTTVDPTMLGRIAGAEPPASGVQVPRPTITRAPTPPELYARANPATAPELFARKHPSTPPVTVPRTKSKPISLPPGAPINAVDLRTEMPEAYPHEGSKGIHIIPIDDDQLDAEPYDADLDGLTVATGDISFDDDTSAGTSLSADDAADRELAAFEDRTSTPVIEVEPPDELSAPIRVEVEEELGIDDIEEIPLPEPRAIGTAALRALAATPLFADLPGQALEALVENLAIVPLLRGEVLFREGDTGDALYVIVEGEVAVQAEGPPRVEMARLGPGSFIGEIALMTDQPRSATVTGTMPSELLRIDRATLASVLADHGDVMRAVLRFVRERLVDRWMRTSPLFRPLTDEQRSQLATRFSFLEIEPGTKLITSGARPDGLYIILAGHFIVQRNTATITSLGAGDLIGETALLSGGTFRSDVTARSKGLALCLPAATFREMIMTHPHVLEYIGEQAELSRRLQIL